MKLHVKYIQKNPLHFQLKFLVPTDCEGQRTPRFAPRGARARKSDRLTDFVKLANCHQV